VTRYTITFPGDKLSRKTRKMPSGPLVIILIEPSLERRLDSITKLIKDVAFKQRLGDVQVEIGTHRGTLYSRDIPLSVFTIDPPLERNG
jgi:hypothetical protein